MKKPKILFITERYWPVIGGIEEGVRRLAELLKESYSIKILTMRNSASGNSLFRTTAGLKTFKSYADPSGNHVAPFLPGLLGRAAMLPIMLRHAPGVRRVFPHWSYNTLYVFFKLAMRKRITRHISESSLAVCFSGDYFGVLTQETCNKLNIPIIFIPSIHPHQWNDSPMAVRSYQKSEAVISYTAVTRKYLESFGKFKSPVTTIPLPIHEFPIPSGSIFRNKYSVPGPLVLFAGRRESYKGLHILFEVFERIVKKVPTARLVVIGPKGNGKPLPRTPWCIDQGKVSEKEKAEIFSASDILCVPSASESLGLVYLEAWYCAKPVIARKIPVTEEIIEHEADGLLVDKNPDNLHNALLELIRNKEKREKIGKTGKEKYDQYYSNRIIKEKMTHLISNLL